MDVDAQSDFGLINMVLRSLGLPIPLGCSIALYEAVTDSDELMGLRGRRLDFPGALQGVPKQYYEAAQVDGTNWWHRFWRITVPALSPIILFQLIMGLIGAFQIFTESYILAGARWTEANRWRTGSVLAVLRGQSVSGSVRLSQDGLRFGACLDFIPDRIADYIRALEDIGPLGLLRR